MVDVPSVVTVFSRHLMTILSHDHIKHVHIAVADLRGAHPARTPPKIVKVTVNQQCC